MTENASQVFIHHYIESASNLYFGMTCCIVLAVVIVFVLAVLLGIVVYVVVSSRRCKRHSKKSGVSGSQEIHSLKGIVNEGASCGSVTPPASTVRRDFSTGISSHSQNIPLTTFSKREKANDRVVESSVSSSGLYDVLFPQQHEEGIALEAPTKLVKFSKKTFPSTSKDSLDDPKVGQSTSGLSHDNTNESLDWDYYQQNLSDQQEVDNESLNSEIEVEVDSEKIRTVCWV